jgi:hypothetical protein
MKRRFGFAAAFGLAALAAVTIVAAARPTPDEGTVTGQVIDTSCYLAQGLYGDGHRACAEICGRDKGIALAIVDDKGVVWHLVDSAMPGSSQNGKVLPYAEQFVKASGTVFTSGPNRAIIVKDIQLVKGTRNAQALKPAAANPCAAKQAQREHGGKANPCAGKNPCAAKPKPAGQANPCAAKANPCAAETNPCARN